MGRIKTGQKWAKLGRTGFWKSSILVSDLWGSFPGSWSAAQSSKSCHPWVSEMFSCFPLCIFVALSHIKPASCLMFRSRLRCSSRQLRWTPLRSNMPYAIKIDPRTCTGIHWIPTDLYWIWHGQMGVWSTGELNTNEHQLSVNRKCVDIICSK
jgi:hypothetical protein